MRRLVVAAAAAHTVPPATLTSFEATVESEATLLMRRRTGAEVPLQVEQFAGRVEWWRSGGLRYDVLGYRARFLGLTPSALSFLRAPWLIGPLYGDRVAVLPAARRGDEVRDANAVGTPVVPGQADEAGSTSPPPARPLLHPFGRDRAKYYRFNGGDTAIVLRLPGRTVDVVRIGVQPTDVPAKAFVFSGDVYIDASRHQIVRMRGRLIGRERTPSSLARLLEAATRSYLFLDLENAEWEGAWLPHRQRIEVEVDPTLVDEEAVLRIVSEFYRTEVHGPDSATGPGLPASNRERILKLARPDSLSAYRAWRRDLGAMTVESGSHHSEELASATTGVGGSPKVTFDAGGVSDVLRFNRVEGLFTGFGMRMVWGNSVPGVFVEGHGGYAWAESTVRGVITGGVEASEWDVWVAAGRRLASTNDFPRVFAARPTVLGVLGRDNFDYVDRKSAEVGGGISSQRGATLDLSAGWVEDRAPSSHVDRPPLGGAYRALRPVFEGGYARISLGLTVGGLSGGEYLTPGRSAGIRVELARGDLAWLRVEGVFRARERRGRWTLAGEVYGGWTEATRPPPQSLFEVGGLQGRLPGFEYKAFVGDRTAVGGMGVTYSLPVLEWPMRVGRVFLPPPVPSPSVEVHAGWTGASAAAESIMRRFGWNDTDGTRAALFVGFRMFGDAFRLGFARPLGEAGRWRFEWTLSSGL
ncbi:MAG: hypothetical protein ACE5GJ_02390 [Gemmatimonadota bacterium]